MIPGRATAVRFHWGRTMGLLRAWTTGALAASLALACTAPTNDASTSATAPAGAPSHAEAGAPERQRPARPSHAAAPSVGDQLVVTGQGFGADLAGAREKAVADAYSEAARRRGTHVRSWLRDELRSDGDDRFEAHSIQEATLLLQGATLGEPRARREPGGTLVEIDLFVSREQLEPGVVVSELGRRPDARQALLAFAVRAVARDDVDAAALAYELLLRDDLRADDLLQLAGLFEQRGDLPAAVALLDRWRPRLPDDDPRLGALRASLADRMLDAEAEVDGLLAAVRRSAPRRLALRTDRARAAYTDPVRVYGAVPPDQRLLLLWFDAASIEVFAVLEPAALASGRLDKSIDYVDPDTGRADPAGFVPGTVHLLALSTDELLTPPAAVDLAACARDDMTQRSRLRSLVRTVEELLRREGTDVQLLGWTQTDVESAP